jgi:hypothetical protein
VNCWCHVLTLVIVDDFHIMGIAVSKNETNAPPRIDCHGPLVFPITFSLPHGHCSLLRNWSEPHHMDFAIKTSCKAPFQDAVIGKRDFINISTILGNATERYVLDVPA